MKRQEFEEKLTEKMLEVRKLSERFFTDNPEYDVMGNGYVSIAVYRGSVGGNTDPSYNRYVDVFKEIKA